MPEEELHPRHLEAPKGFEFRPYAAGPERDTARVFFQVIRDLNWLAEGPDKDQMLIWLKEARDAAMRAAKKM